METPTALIFAHEISVYSITASRPPSLSNGEKC